MDEITQKRRELKVMRTKKNFDFKYRDKGGLDRLNKFVEQRETLTKIAEHFGLTTARMSVIVETILGVPYTQYLVDANTRRQGVKKP